MSKSENIDSMVPVSTLSNELTRGNIAEAIDDVVTLAADDVELASSESLSVAVGIGDVYEANESKDELREVLENFGDRGTLLDPPPLVRLRGKDGGIKMSDWRLQRTTIKIHAFLTLEIRTQFVNAPPPPIQQAPVQKGSNCSTDVKLRNFLKTDTSASTCQENARRACAYIHCATYGRPNVERKHKNNK